MRDLGQVSEINVPCQLPDLPGIADDLRYTEDLSPGIAPLDPDTTIPELLASPIDMAKPFEPEPGTGVGPLSSSDTSHFSHLFQT